MPERSRREEPPLPLPLADGGTAWVRRVREPRARRLRLSVDERGARLSLPLRASLVSGDRFVAEHADWLRAQLVLHRRHAPEPFVPWQSTCLPLAGETLALTWREALSARLLRDGDGLCFHAPRLPRPGQVSRGVLDFYRAEGQARLARLLPKYLVGLPRPPARVQFRRMASLWGSLSVDGGMRLDLALVLAPPQVFEYVLVHELCHLIRHDHSPAYWREVAQRCPGWPAQRDWLRREGQALKAQLAALAA
jgi:predicted metal-dependent hydrolase